MSEFTLHDLQCFDAVVREGGFQAAAETLHRSHPAVFAAVAKLERQLDLQLLDRGGYRVKPTPAGQSFHRRAQALLRELAGLRAHAEQLSMGQESELNVVIGDFCPRPLLLGLLGKFFAQWPATRLNLHFEAVTGPWERLLEGDADLILHRMEAGDARVEWLDLGRVPFVPVAAPGYLAPARRALRPEDLRDYTQCVMRDTARHAPARDFFMIEGGAPVHGRGPGDEERNHPARTGMGAHAALPGGRRIERRPAVVAGESSPAGQHRDVGGRAPRRPAAGAGHDAPVGHVARARARHPPGRVAGKKAQALIPHPKAACPARYTGSGRTVQYLPVSSSPASGTRVSRSSTLSMR